MDKDLLHVEHLYRHGSLMSRDVAYKLLEQCARNKDIEAGRHVYAFMVSSGLAVLSTLGDHLIRLFGAYGNFLEVNLVFCGLAEPSAHSWQAILSAHARVGNFNEAFNLYCRMQDERMQHSEFIISSMLKLCNENGALEEGRLIHEEVISSNLEADVVIGSTLVNLYANHWRLKDARVAFDRLNHKDLVVWNTMIAAYSQHGLGLQALELYDCMQEESIRPNAVTFSSALQACSITKDVRKGREVISLIDESGLSTDVVVGSAIVDMYAQCGCLKDAQESFNKLSELNLMTWNALIAAYAGQGLLEAALEIFLSMHSLGVEPDRVTLLPLLKSCGCFRSIDYGRLLHIYITRNGFSMGVVLGTSLIDMYIGFGGMEDAYRVFDTLPERNTASWGAIIEGFILHGSGLEALEVFSKMPPNVRPDNFMLLSVLKACGDLGASVQGMMMHDRLIRWSHELGLVFATTLITMYANCGNLIEAHKVFSQLAYRDVVALSAMAAAYSQHGYFNLARQCLEEMLRQGLIPDVGIYTNLLAACSHACDVSEGLLCFGGMREHGLIPGIKHYNSIIVLLSQAGCLKEAAAVLQSMPSAYTTGWTTLLAACGTYKSLVLGADCFNRAVELDLNVGAGYVLMSKMYV